MDRFIKNYLFLFLQCINLIVVICFLFGYNLFIINDNDFEQLVFISVYIVFPIISIILWIFAILFNLDNDDSKFKRINFYVPFLINLGFLNVNNICRFHKYLYKNIYHVVLLFAPLIPLFLIIVFLMNNKNDFNSVVKYILNIILMLTILSAYIWLVLLYILEHSYSIF